MIGTLVQLWQHFTKGLMVAQDGQKERMLLKTIEPQNRDADPNGYERH